MSTNIKQQIADAAQKYSPTYTFGRALAFRDGANFGLKLSLNSPEVRAMRELVADWYSDGVLDSLEVVVFKAFDQLLKEVGE